MDIIHPSEVSIKPTQNGQKVIPVKYEVKKEKNVQVQNPIINQRLAPPPPQVPLHYELYL